MPPKRCWMTSGQTVRSFARRRESPAWRSIWPRTSEGVGWPASAMHDVTPTLPTRQPAGDCREPGRAQKGAHQRVSTRRNQIAELQARWNVSSVSRCGAAAGDESRKIGYAAARPRRRAGFFEPRAVPCGCSRISRGDSAVITFAYLTGWRMPSEVLPLQWRQVIFNHRRG